MQRRDRGLDDIGAAAAQGQRPVERGAAGGDLLRVPERAVLVGEQHQLAIAEACPAAGVVQQHQREQAVHLGLVGHQLGERPPEAQGLGHQLSAAAVAGVEDQVCDREHGCEPIGQQVVRRHPERDPGGLDLVLGAHEPARHRRLADQEGARDLGGAEAAERAQRERDLRLRTEGGMTAGEDELEPLVRKWRRVHVLLGRLRHLEQARLRRQRAITADAIDRPVARRRHEPGARAGRRSLAWPALRRDREGLLRGFLGEVEVAEEADQRGQHAPPLVAERLLEDRHHSTIGRTSMAPPMAAAGIRAASSIAASRSAASNSR